PLLGFEWLKLITPADSIGAVCSAIGPSAHSRWQLDVLSYRSLPPVRKGFDGRFDGRLFDGSTVAIGIPATSEDNTLGPVRGQTGRQLLTARLTHSRAVGWRICTTSPLAKHLYFAGNCESASSNWEIVVMRRFALVIALMAGMIAPAMAQKA